MGAADVVPGVSGGTIAFISGIYEKLLASINSIDTHAIKLLSGFKIKELWQYINGNFLLILISGIFLSIVSLSRIVLYLLENHAVLLWSFFFGLILGSVFLILPQIKKWHVGVVLAGIIGTIGAFYITTATPTQTPEALYFIFFSGALAICAMILPGISGSFILLILGKYEYILNSLKEFNISVILTFGAGCIAGLLTFARVLKHLLNNYHNITIAILTGFMLGSLNKVWPWKETIETFTDRHGNIKPLIQRNVSPFDFKEITGQEPYFIGAVALAIIGFVAVYLLGSLSMRKETKA